MFTAKWHFTLSTQRHLSINLSAQRQLSVMFPTQKWSLIHSSAQRQLPVCSLHEVCDILYDRPLDWVLLARAIEGHPLHQSGHSIHVSHPHHLIFHNAAGAHSCHGRPHYYCHLQWVWGHLRNFFWWLVPLQTCSYSNETRLWCHSPDNFWLFGGWGGFWQGGQHLWFISLRALNQPFPQTLTMRPLFWASQ